MVNIKPFKGVRPRRDLAHLVASPPYDVLSSEEARTMAEGNPYSFLHIGKPEIDLPSGIDIYSDAVYAKGKENFQRFLEAGILFQDKTECFYAYKQIWKEHVQVGLVAAASCQDYLDGIIKKHELTRPDKENDRTRHIETLNAQTGPVFLTYRRREAINALVARMMENEPEYDFSTDDGVTHIFWVVDSSEIILNIKEEFASIDCLYVADGHHRSAAASRVKLKRQRENPAHTGKEEYNFFLAVIFPHDQTKILPYNRLVKDLNGLSLEAFFGRVDNFFSRRLTENAKPQKPKEFCLFINGKWHQLEPKPGTYDPQDPIDSLDVSILQKNLLAPILGIEDPRTDKRIDFVGGIRGTAELERRVQNGEFAAAFSLYPTTIDQLFAVADSGKIMPPKSTWFEPKLKDGLATHVID